MAARPSAPSRPVRYRLIPPIHITPERQRLLERALPACGRLDAITTLLPDLLLFELDEMPGVPFDDVVEVSNYVAALDDGLKRLREGFPLSNRLLREIHANLRSGRSSPMKRPNILFGRADLIDDPEHAERARRLAPEADGSCGLPLRS